MILRLLCSIGALLTIVYCVQAQTDNESKVSFDKNAKTNVFPVAFYLPETGFGFGVAGVSAFRLAGESPSTRVSSVQLGLSYTTKNQLLFFLPYELYLDNQRWRIFGELGWYKYFYNYYGKGNLSNAQDLQIYNVNFPRLRANVLRALTNSLFIGVGYQFDDYRKIGFEGVGVLQDEQSFFGLVNELRHSSVGIIGLWDNRDHLFYPTKGAFVQFDLYGSSSAVGADNRFVKFQLDGRMFKQLGKRSVLAANLVLGLQSSGVPFVHYYYVGSKLTRGFADRRFQDQSIMSMTFELRREIGTSRFGLNVFASGATVGRSLTDVISDKKHFSGGLGFRYILNKRDGVRLRLDYGFSAEGSQFYFTIGEAF